MPDHDSIREIAAKAFSEALQDKSREFAENVADRMRVALELQGSEARPMRERSKDLRDGTTLIAGSRTQSETLETLLAACSALTPSCGLLVLRGAQAAGYSCIGITAVDKFKRATMDCSKGIAATVIRSRIGSATKVSELDPFFTARLGLESSAEILLLPVSLKERVAALLIALSQQGDELAGLEVLVQVAQLTMDVQAYRKAAQQHAAAPPAAPLPLRAVASAASDPSETRPTPAFLPPEPASVHSDSMAVSPTAVPSTPAEAEAVAPVPEPPVVTVCVQTAPTMIALPVMPTSTQLPASVVNPPATSMPSPMVAPAVALPPAPVYRAPESQPPPAPASPPASLTFSMNAAPQAQAAQLQDSAHDKARRFAKLLVEEIKLYNQTKVAEGRARADLYSRLRDDIEKSRAAYQRRYGESVSGIDYFNQELLRILADNNRAVMGAGFPE